MYGLEEDERFNDARSLREFRVSITGCSGTAKGIIGKIALILGEEVCTKFVAPTLLCVRH